MNCLNMENPENPQEWYGVNEHRFCTVLEVKDGKIISRSSAFSFPVIHGDIWYTLWTGNISLPAIPSGSVRTAATALFLRWRRTISWLCSHWRSWSGNCAHVGCIHISSPVTRDGRTILPLRLPTKTRAVHHSKNEYTTHRHPMMPTTNRTTPKKMQRAVF